MRTNDMMLICDADDVFCFSRVKLSDFNQKNKQKKEKNKEFK